MSLLCSWSGGKDSCFALMQTHQHPQILLNALNEEEKISRSHGIPREILEAQARAIGTEIDFISATWQDYTTKFVQKLQTLQKEYNLTTAVFGDIDLEPHRAWEEDVCQQAQLECLLPLWQQNRRTLVEKMINSGIKAMIVSCNSTLGPDFLGKIIDHHTVDALDQLGVDVCGENGEFHTLVLDCPLFSSPISVNTGEKCVNETGYNFLTLQLQA